ncbi:MAG: hypothetical protein ACFE0J_22225 [Elainellaceae cyanobacterium]
MTWFTIAQFTPILDWQTVTETIGGELFRVDFSIPSTGQSTKSWIRLRQYYPQGGLGVSQSRVIYPQSTPVVLELPIPTELKESGYTVRSLQVKRFSRYRTFTEPNYSVVLQEWF